MSTMSAPFRLLHRAVVDVSGPDAEGFLQGVLTQSTLGMGEGEVRAGALLTPQGRVIADLLIHRTGEGFLLDAPAAQAAALVRRLTFFRLRAQVSVAGRPDLAVVCGRGAADPRSAELPLRGISPVTELAAPASPETQDPDAAGYHAIRITAGVAEGGSDFDAEEVFPADVNMDHLHGVDFRKGCFVGQEVVSRMKRKGAPRRRTLVVQFDAPPELAEVKAGPAVIGELSSSRGGMALARIRTDRLKAAETEGSPITCDGRPINIVRPPWLEAELAAL